MKTLTDFRRVRHCCPLIFYLLVQISLWSSNLAQNFFVSILSAVYNSFIEVRFLSQYPSRPSGLETSNLSSSSVPSHLIQLSVKCQLFWYLFKLAEAVVLIPLLLLACVAWRFWLGAHEGGRGQRNHVCCSLLVLMFSFSFFFFF